ncbi:hypothetical protein MA05_04610 [Comamonas aquatica]|nr:hypothetical protein MA05_04610 [Comamonas aquatica]
MLDTPAFSRQYLAVTDLQAAQVDRLYIDLGQELRLISQKLKEDCAQAQTKTEGAAPSHSEASELSLHVSGEDTLLSWPLFPMRLGRMSSRLVGDGLHFHHEAQALPAQLQALRASKPDKQHFRVAFINGFGINLGDCTMGVTAFRQVAQCLARYLPSFACDLLYGAGASAALVDIVAEEESIERVLFHAPTVSELAQYDGYFDFSGLIGRPQYDSLPTVDWYLWWCGLDPHTVPAAHKRNRGQIRWDAWNAVRGLLQDKPGQKIFFNPKASVPLRTMPAQVALKFAKRLLELAPEMTLVIDQPMDLQHKRLMDLSSQIHTPEKFKALCAQVDGLITVNSFASHVADLCSTPAVHVCSTIPASRYPYYPFSAAINVPGYEQLPAFNQPKVEPEKWETMGAVYHTAWERLAAAQVLTLLREKIAQRQAAADEPQGLALVAEPKAATYVERNSATPRLVRQRLAPENTRASERFAQLAQSALKPGSVCVLACAPDPSLAVTLARRVAHHGELIVLEPRPLLARCLESSLLTAGAFVARVQQTMAVPGGQQTKINALDPWSESNSCEWGNTLEVIAVPNRSVDEMALKACHCLLVQSPMPFKEVVAGASETLLRCRPYLLISPVRREEAGAICKTALDADYVFWAESAAPGGDMGTLLLFGMPKEKQVKVDGFFKVE